MALDEGRGNIPSYSKASLSGCKEHNSFRKSLKETRFIISLSHFVYKNHKDYGETFLDQSNCLEDRSPMFPGRQSHCAERMWLRPTELPRLKLLQFVQLLESMQWAPGFHLLLLITLAQDGWWCGCHLGHFCSCE